MDWSQHYPHFSAGVPNASHSIASRNKTLTQEIEIADIGCGFGGLLFALSPRLPRTLILGLEIRSSVSGYVAEKIKVTRQQNEPAVSDADQPGTPIAAPYHNISVIRANTMKFLPNFFYKAQLRAIFLCFPDPHFKARKHKARIVSHTLNSEYAYVMKPGGIVYTITDVKDLHDWMVERFEGHPGFERVDMALDGLADRVQVEPDRSQAEPADGRVGQGEMEMCVGLMLGETEEGKKVTRNGGSKHVALFRRLPDADWPVQS